MALSGDACISQQPLALPQLRVRHGKSPQLWQSRAGEGHMHDLSAAVLKMSCA